ncbi:adenylate/guanylate cyclase domain-containing protein [Methylobacterium sp. 275MFSha3.1]|uniref:adenylate/guanylate cyclase domain-containing protein n=1 Tax=Methylobacterium sp. 275MFSha3.1 TaxID=1502746 RepID=UPI000B816EBC|nr:adenylate/guanylate cyclase domain-containing protein [Methylobacterium sp. 275MFSha3.1]
MMERAMFPSFPADLEEEFQCHYAKTYSNASKSALALGSSIYLSFAIWDYITAPEIVSLSLAIRFSVTALLLLSMTFFGGDRLPQAILALDVFLAGASVVLIISNMHNGLTLGMSGIVLCLMFNFGFFRLLFMPSLFGGLSLMLAYNAAVLASGLRADLAAANNFFIVSAIAAGSIVTFRYESLQRTSFLQDKEIESERARSEALIDNMLPRHIAARLKQGDQVIAESHGEAHVLFADLVGFTTLTKQLSPHHLVEVLNEIFSIADGLTEIHGVEKVKTIGDGYMVVSGIDGETRSAAESMANFALDLVSEVESFAQRSGYPIAVRVGIATGQLISGVIGLRKLSFDLWGDTVNLASRMEHSSEQGQIQVTETTYWRLRENYHLEERGKIFLKGFGELNSYVLIGRQVFMHRLEAKINS